MIGLSFQELFLRLIPEALLYIFSLYVFSRTEINIKRFMVSSVFFGIIVYLIRLLPIQYGVHTILGLIVLIIIGVQVNKIDIVKSIQASIIGVIIGLISETINILIIQYIFKMDLNYVFNDYKLKVFMGIPSILIFGLVVYLFNFIILKKNKLREILNGKTKQ